VDIVRPLVENYPDNKDFQDRLAKSLANRAVGFRNLQRYDEALADCNKSIKLNPKDAFAFSVRSKIYDRLKKYDEAMGDVTKAIELDPNSGEHFNNRATLHDHFEQYDKALAEYSKAIDMSPNNITVYGNRASLYARLGRREEALVDYEMLHHSKPDSAYEFNNAAWCLAMAAEDLRPKYLKRAVEFAHRAVELEQTNRHYWNTLGVAQYYAGDLQAATQALNKALDLPTPHYNEAYDTFFLAMAHWRLGHSDEAKKWYAQAIQWMDENNPGRSYHAHKLRRFRAEAEQLLGLKTTATQETTSQATP
jgi:tetratricopeptide (TPR) repeat protein